MNDERTKRIIKLVREHPKLGRGSCSTYDECYDDPELAAYIEEFHFDGTDEEVLAELIETESAYWDVQEDHENTWRSEAGLPLVDYTSKWGKK
jgi:hypothetical protein